MDTSLMINRKDKDRSATKEREQNLNEFQDWLMSGIIDPQRAKEIIEHLLQRNAILGEQNENLSRY